MRFARSVCVPAAALLLHFTSTTATAQDPRITFGAGTPVILPITSPAGLASADLNHDGHLDVAVTGLPSSTGRVNTVNTFTGDGTTSFQDSGGFVFTFAAGLATGDLNGDGVQDLVATQNVFSKNGIYGDPVCGSIVGIAVAFGPRLLSALCIASVPSPVAVQIGDFDNDGRPDIAVVSGQFQGLLIYTHLDFSTFAVTTRSVPGSGLQATGMSRPIDLNGDGFLDLIVSHRAGVAVFLGNGDGTFRAGPAASSAGAAAVAAGDVNGDGWPDIAWIETAINGRVLVALGSAAGTLTVQTVATIGSGMTDLAIADLDRDTHPDLVVAHNSAGRVLAFFGNGDGVFVSPALPLAVGIKPRLLAVRDWNEDGELDIAVVDSSIAGQNAVAWFALQDGLARPDTIPPTVSLTAPAEGAAVSGRTAVAATATDYVGVTRVEFLVNERSIGQSAGPDYTVSWDTTRTANGPATVTARAFDATLNESQWSTVHVIVDNKPPDTIPPVVTVPGDLAVEATSAAGGVVTYLVSATDNVDGSLTATCDPPSGETFVLGATLVTCSATDAPGNTGIATFTITVTDTTPPALTLPADATVTTADPKGATHTFTASATDLVAGSVTVTCDQASGALFPVGTTTVHCSASDGANVATGSFMVTVVLVDTTPPVVTVPADLVVEATSPSGAIVTYAASGIDNIDNTVPVTCDQASGATFPIAATLVTCSATDAHGDTGSAQFMVTVRDTTPPALSLPGDVTVTASDAAGATHTYTTTAIDLVAGSVATTCEPASGSLFPVGTTAVFCSASDGINVASGSFLVNVLAPAPVNSAAIAQSATILRAASRIRYSGPAL